MRLVLVLLLCLVVSLPGIKQLPADGHEVLVLGSVQEMAANGDWVVPYFNGEPRLNKPPLNYWATGLLAWGSGSLPVVLPWHGRLVSVFAALLLVAFTYLWGGRITSPRTAQIAAAMMAVSAGVFSYAHDARPEMLYACLCAVAYLGFGVTLLEKHRPATPGRVYCCWALLGLATLTKGPQIPLLLLLALALFVLFSARARERWSRLHPISGFLLMAGVIAPWAIALNAAVDSTMLQHSQLGGALLIPELSNLADPYYLYRPLQLVLPWWIAPLALFLLDEQRDLPRHCAFYLLVSICVAAIGLSFGTQQRFFYMLPYLPMLFLLSAIGIERLQRSKIGRALLYFQMLTIFGVLAWLCYEARTVREMLAAALVLLAVAISRRYFRLPQHMPTTIVASCSIAALIFGLFGPSDAFWSDDRRHKYQFGSGVIGRLDAGRPIYAWVTNPNVYVYYARRRIPQIQELARFHIDHDQEVLVISPATRVADLKPYFSITTVGAMPRDAPDRDVVLAVRHR
ncbi:MAG: glycosyltransferase family 39 protein [Pseudomonadota bacterium]